MSIQMSIRDTLKAEIAQEREEKQTFSQTDLSALVESGNVQQALDDLLFFVPPQEFDAYTRTLRQEIEDEFATADQERQTAYLRFLTRLTLALRSHLARWNLRNRDLHGDLALSEAEIEMQANQLQELIAELELQAPAATEKLLGEWRSRAVPRFEAEEAENPVDEAVALVGSSINDYIDNVSQAINNSNVRRIAEMRADGLIPSEWSNDHGAFLDYALYLGASFVTCNPPLVDRAWQAFPEQWNPVVDRVIAENAGASDDELARLVTLEVVLHNMRLLRPIFLLNDGGMGCVCFQVNPHNHADAEAMTADAVAVYESLQQRLGGGVPNIVFKLPGTQAGLETCRALTQRGIGVTITVNFGLFQHIPFAEAIREGQSLYSNLVEMHGRLAYPVRDELLGRLDELAEHGIDEARAREAAAWSGVAVMKRIQQLLKEQGYDLSRAKPLSASFRVYEGHGYEDLPNPLLDITEIVGLRIISIFPNIRRSFDAQPPVELTPYQIDEPVADEILETLTHSEIFKQAYYVADRNWVPDGDARSKPDDPLALEDEESVFNWEPVYNTITGFSDAYDQFVRRIREQQRLAEPAS